MFGRDDALPFTSSTVGNRAKATWRAAGLRPITLHECRHTFASLCIAAGVNAKCLSAYMGHTTIGLTFDLYGHLMPGNEAEATGLLDAYLLRHEGHSGGSPAATRAVLSGPERNRADHEIPAAMPETAD